jgi:hypothetical protein
MRRNLVKSVIVLAALALLALMPVVEATYMLGHPYIGTAPKTTEARRWALSGFYEGREMPQLRQRMVKSYYADGAQGRAWRTSILGREGAKEVSYSGMKPLMSGTRCLGCELGTYNLQNPYERRGRYYYSLSRVAGRSKFVYTGDMGMKPPTVTTAGTGGKRMRPVRAAAARSRLTLSQRDLALLREETESSLGGYQLRTGRRCLTCEYESGKRLGRYYVTTPEVQEVRSYVPLQENQ